MSPAPSTHPHPSSDAPLDPSPAVARRRPRPRRHGGHTLPDGREFADDFHTFAVAWAPGRITWSVDGTVYLTRTPADLGGHDWVCDKPFFLILNLAVGGDWLGAPSSRSGCSSTTSG